MDVDDHRDGHCKHVNTHAIFYDSDENTLHGHCIDINLNVYSL